MRKVKYQARNGNQQWKPSLSWLMGQVESDANSGFCLACGDDADGVEPDARKYQCHACGAHKVYGAEELILMGLYYSDQGRPDNRTSHDYSDPRTQVPD